MIINILWEYGQYLKDVMWKYHRQAEAVLKKLLASGMSADEILEKLK